jgi:hypothetical protein
MMTILNFSDLSASRRTLWGCDFRFRFVLVAKVKYFGIIWTAIGNFFLVSYWLTGSDSSGGAKGGLGWAQPTRQTVEPTLEIF